MTDGEKMVWAAAFALAASELRKHISPGDVGRRASLEADKTVIALRFGGCGEMSEEMSKRDLRAAGAG